MRAVVIATDNYPNQPLLHERTPAVLLPLVDKPFIQHMVESLVDGGFSEFDFVLSNSPEKIEEFLGDGTRWGCEFRYHLVRQPARTYENLAVTAGIEHEETVLLLHGDRICQLPQAGLERVTARSLLPTVYVSRDHENELQWTGWAFCSGSILSGLPAGCDEKTLGEMLISAARAGDSLIECPAPLGFHSGQQLLASQKRAMSGEFSGITFRGKQSEPGVWISKNVSLHPTVRVIAPVYIGENCRIGEGAQIGPNAVIESDCVLDARCTVANSAIFRGSYVGEGLELADVIVDKNRLVNVRMGATVRVADDFILGSLAPRHLGRGLAALASRALGIVLLIVTSPILLAEVIILWLFRKGPVMGSVQTVQLPGDAHNPVWPTVKVWNFLPHHPDAGPQAPGPSDGPKFLFLVFLPALINIARGELRFVGVQPRTREEVSSLPEDWRALYLSSKAGMITEAFVHYGAWPTEDEVYSAEAFYAVRAGLGHDLKLVAGYARRIFLDLFRRPELRVEPSGTK